LLSSAQLRKISIWSSSAQRYFSAAKLSSAQLSKNFANLQLWVEDVNNKSVSP